MARENLEIVITARDEAKGVLGGLTNILGGTLKTGLGIAGAAVGALGAGFGLLGSQVGIGLNSLMRIERISAQTEAVIESTGGAAGLTAQQISDMSGEIERLTATEAESTQNAANMLLTFTSLGADVFPDALQATVDMARAFDKTGDPMLDMTSQAVMIGKALQDPILGVSALRRVGVNFNEEATEMIKNMVETGDVAGAQKYILRELATEFGGSAEAFAQTTKGKLELVKHEFGTLQETLAGPFLGIAAEVFGKVLDVLKNPELTAAITKLGENISWLFEVFMDTGTVMSSEFQEALTLFLPESVVSGVYEFIQRILELKNTIMGFINEVLVPFISAHAAEFKGALIGIAAVLAGAGIISGILSVGAAIAALLNPVTLVIAIAALLGAAWAGNWFGIRDKTAAVINFLKPFISGALAAIQQFWTDHGAQIIATVQGLWEGVKTAFEGAKTVLLAIGKAFSLAFQGDWRGFGEALRRIWDQAWTAIKTRIQSAITNIKNSFRNTDWRSVGRNIIDGIAAGISAAISVIKNAAIRAAKAALDAAKGFLGIDSPSKVFRNVGLNMMQGMAKGIQGNAGIPAGAAAAAAGVATSAAGGIAVARGAGITVGEITIIARPGQSGATLASDFVRRAYQASRSSGSARFSG